MEYDGPPLIFSILGVLVGVGVAWLLTGETGMALVFVVIGLGAVIGWRLVKARR